MTSTLQPTAELKGHQKPVLCVKYAQNTFLGEHILASGSEDNTCRIWDLRTQQVVKGIKGLQDPVSSVAYGPTSDSSLFYLSSGKKVFVYDLRNSSMIVSETCREYEFSGDEINSIDINQKQTFLATGDDNGEVKIVDLVNHKIYKKLNKKHRNICMSVKFSQRKAWEVWSGGLDCKVHQWDFSKGKLLDIYDTAPSEPSSSQMFNPPFVYTIGNSMDGSWVAAGLGDASIQLFNFGDKKTKRIDPLVSRLEDGHSNMVNCLSFLPGRDESQEQVLLSGSVNGSLALWHLPTMTAPNNQPSSKYQLDSSVARLNQLETYTMDGKTTTLAAAGVGGVDGNGGVLNLYSLS
ncbi:unnamed protein product [Absidia cylindrospora]